MVFCYKMVRNYCLVKKDNARSGMKHIVTADCPYDNAVAESVYRAFKIEFIHQETFQPLKELILKTKDYVYWWNYRRMHGSLNYQTPMTKRLTV
ncbi:transposase-like protein [Streptococcus dysgalactiae subsp. dysgalactiae]|uniref:Transposase-like protein n=1 Tax=Streptococcus dysgalactiae subsp. dysgalactiae TaxID=99822 RepID=A0A380JT23_STRDY|nr:transposase-like protein [Streptococcus dysgalactiae subsp. dysgalactiae]